MASKTRTAQPAREERPGDADIATGRGGQNELKKRVVPKADGRYLIYYERERRDP